MTTETKGETTTKAIETMMYAVVPMPGLYGSGTRVRPEMITTDIHAAWQRANRATGQLRRAMRRHGGTVGGYRVVEWDAWTACEAIPGHALDRVPTAHG